VRNGDRLAILTGPPGCGKTTVAANFRAQFAGVTALTTSRRHVLFVVPSDETLDEAYCQVSRALDGDN
jgi:broad-specificity NMP kinase